MRKHISIYLIILLFGASCNKYLDAKPDSKLVVPESIADLQSLLDNSNIMNLKTIWSGEGSADNYFLPDDLFSALEPYQRNVYTWSENSIPDELPNDWSATYNPIYYSNLVLEGIGKIARNDKNKAAWDNVKGSALLFRAKYLLDAVLLWANIYDKNTAATDLGVPIRLTSDFNIPSKRASLQECYNQILSDLKEAASLLPDHPVQVMRPSTPAAYSLLARTFLMMQNFDSAGDYANKALQIKSDLLDFNTLDLTSDFPFERFNKEVIMYFTMPNQIYWLAYHADTTLYNSYDTEDLRKQAFFRANGDGTFNSFSSSYAQEYVNFTGLAVDEMILTRAECYARNGKLTEALEDLNTLMRNRWQQSSFVPFTANSPDETIKLILTERRKELLLRGTRWMDLKRLNKEPALAKELERVVNGEQVILLPNSNAYSLPIPNNIIKLSGIAQNPR